VRPDEVTGLTLDAGALIAVERLSGRVRALIQLTFDRGREVAVPAGSIAQAWRGGSRQAQLARLLATPGLIVVPLDEAAARAVGVLCGQSRHHDIVDVHVALHATEMGHHVVTSDPDDIRAVHPSLRVIAV
jgi:predicted nucleic acid-binding protein